MAAIVPTQAQIELVNSLTQDEIPIKLRCATCSKLAVNAFRLPCCDQALCEICQSALATACPVCEHTPLVASDCKPHKSLRTTVKVFLRTEEKKRDAQRQKFKTDTPPITPSEPIAESELPSPVIKDLGPSSDTPAVGAAGTTLRDAPEQKAEQLEHKQQDIPQQSVEEVSLENVMSVEASSADKNVSETEASKEMSEVADDKEASGNLQETANESNMIFAQQSASSTGTDFASSATPASNMSITGVATDLNQIQMMMAMQNGMAPNAFGGFPMGFPGMAMGMGMDPMAMQNMFMSGNFGAGMNMGMGMGMNGFDNGTGGGYNNGWNVQPSWNFGQENFIHQSAASMSQGDFGPHNPGYDRQNPAFHEQGNFGQSQFPNAFSHQNGYGGRGRGRGRGGYGYNQGRGDHAQNGQSQMTQQYSHPHQTNQESQAIPLGEEQALNDIHSNVDEFGREKRNPSSDRKDIGIDTAAERDSDDRAAGEHNGVTGDIIDVMQESTKDTDNAQQGDQTVVQTVALPSRFSKNGFAPPADAWDQIPTSLIPHKLAVTAPEIPINAPKGPKAMRDGLPNVSINFLRGRGGFNNAGRPFIIPSTSYTESSVTPAASERVDDDKRQQGVVADPGPPRERSLSAVGSVSRDNSQSRGDGREGRREKDRRRREDRSRSHSMSSNNRDGGSRRSRRSHRSRRHDEARDDHEIEDDTTKENGDRQRSRSPSTSESRRFGHKDSHRSDEKREKQQDRDRDVVKERDHKSSHRHRSSHRSHRERSRSRSANRHSRSHRKRSRSRDHRSSRRHEEKEPRTRDRDHEHVSTDEPEKVSTHHNTNSTSELPIAIPKGPRAMSSAQSKPTAPPNTRGIGIKGSAQRRSAQGALTVADSANPRKDNLKHDRSERHDRDSRKHSSSESTRAEVTKKLPVDPHTMEREARNRERLLKEAQRIAGLAGGKRHRDDGESSNRKKRRSEVEASGLEARVARGERERDARWE